MAIVFVAKNKDSKLITQIKALYDLKKEIPDAVGYSTNGPRKFLLPVEFKNNLSHINSEELNDLTTSEIVIYNYSSKIQRNVRVLYSGDFPYVPRVGFARRDIEPKFENKKSDKELLVFEIPPNESIYIKIFNPDVNFKFTDVIIGDRVISTLMQKLAYQKRYPAPSWLKYIYLLFFLAFFAIAFQFFSIYSSNKDVDFINNAIKSSGLNENKVRCQPYLFENKPTENKILEEKIQRIDPIFKPSILKNNKVNSIEELKNLSKIIFCEKID
jgi:hypothetical protein